MIQIVLLRGINIGANNRIAMPALREALAGARFEYVRTYLQSGNIVLDADLPPDALAEQVQALINARFGLQIPVVTRTEAELARIVESNPLADSVTDPKRYQVSFLSDPLDQPVIDRLRALVTPPEEFAVHERELFAWHPEGVARSKLWNGLAGRLGVTATARNWTTVTALLELARASPGAGGA